MSWQTAICSAALIGVLWTVKHFLTWGMSEYGDAFWLSFMVAVFLIAWRIDRSKAKADREKSPDSSALTGQTGRAPRV